MKSFVIAWKDFKIRVTDRRGFTMMIIMPLILTAILGSALGSVLSNDQNLPHTVIGLVKGGQDHLTETFIKDVLESKDVKKFVTVKQADKEEQLSELLKKGEIDAGIAIPAGWSSDLKNGNLKDVTVYTNPDSQIKGSIAESIASTFTDRVKTLAKAESTAITDLASSAPVTTGKLDLSKTAVQLNSELDSIAKQNKNIQDVTTGKKSVSSMQYYAAGMAVMFLLYNATAGAKSILQERETETLARLMSTPTGNISILLGKFFGTLLFALIQLTIFLTATHLFFGVDWGDNIVQVFAVGLSYAIAVSGLSMILASVISSVKTADLISSIGVQILAILGGSMIPLYSFPDIMQKIAYFAPNKWALSSFLEIMSGAAWKDLLLPAIILLSLGVVSVSIGTWRLKAR